MKNILASLTIFALVPATAGIAQPSQPSAQQQFDAASDALTAGRWEEALRAFEALEPHVTRNRRTLAVVRLRKGRALKQLGREDEAVVALRQGLADLAPDDATLNGDRFLALLTLGEIAELSLDYPGARALYLQAKAIPVGPPDSLAVYRGLIQTEMFEDAPAALAHADEALQLARGASVEDAEVGRLQTLRGRVLLNMGRADQAQLELRNATRHLGGALTTRVDLADIVARSDLAIASMLAGHEEQAREYLAYTGAGHNESDFEPGTGRMIPPRCGGALEPGDVAVIEFSIRYDGSVSHAAPIYASRQGPAATAFARAALGWAWNPESFRQVPALFRTAVRVELRCALGEPEKGDFLRGDIDEAARWTRAHDIQEFAQFLTSRQEPAPQLRRELARVQAANGPQSTLLPVLIALARHPSIGTAERAGYLRRALPIAVAEQAPPTILAAIAAEAERLERSGSEGERRDPPDYAATLANPAIRDNIRAVAAVRIVRALRLFEARHDRDASDLAETVLATPGLAPDDPAIRDAFRLRGALAAGRGDSRAAHVAYQAAGGEALCAYLSRARPNRVSSHDFPNPALRWHFEGWAAVENRIEPDGSVTGARTLIAYPPFVFDDAAERLAARARMEMLGSTCGYHHTVVRYRIAVP